MSANPATGQDDAVPPAFSPSLAVARWILPAFFAALTLVLFGDALIVPGRLPVSLFSDLRSQYLPWREFAFGQIRAGHFPLWNPNQFCGTPFFGDPQSAMLYPPNWLHLLLSPDRAASWLIGIHFFLAGLFTARWLRWRGRSIPASILAGTIYACSGPIIANLRPGHLPLLCSAAWAPLLFHSVDGIFDSDARGKFRWTLIGAAVVAMLALDGYPQFAYYSALTVGLYSLLRLGKAGAKLKVCLLLGTVFAAGWAIAAVQIFACAQVAAESNRGGGLGYWAAAAYSLPPENLLTIIVPGLFGDAVHLLYYGRWYWWETCLFVGPAALALAAYGATLRRCRIQMLMVIIVLLLAMGQYTPLFKLLFEWLPGFSSFRATARFGLIGLLFLAYLAAFGWDHLLSREPVRRRFLLAVISASGLCGLSLILGSIWAINYQSSAVSYISRFIHFSAAKYELMEFPPLTDPTFPAKAVSVVSRQLAIAGVVAMAVTILLALALSRKSSPRRCAVAALMTLAIVQLVIFDLRQRTASDHDPMMPAEWTQALAQLPQDGRALVCSSLFADDPGLPNVVGSNPLVLGRMARFLAATQHDDPAQIGLNLPIRTVTPIYRMLRCGLIIPGRESGPTYPLPDALPRFVLLDQAEVALNSDAALAGVLDRYFDPAQTVILESTPNPAPRPGPGGSVRLVKETTDELEIEADLPSPKILLMTDAYDESWQATSMEAATQSDYRVLPADYCLRAIPLAAGHHHFRLEYRPAAYVLGKWISILALAAYLVAAFYYLKKRSLLNAPAANENDAAR
jgi:hypothetical protein